MAGSPPRKKTFGTEAAGFRIDYAPGGHRLRLDGWGYWPPEVAAAFGEELAAACRAVTGPVEFRFNGPGLKPQGEDGREALRALLHELAGIELSGATIAVDNPLTKMQLTRLASASGVGERLTFESTPDPDAKEP